MPTRNKKSANASIFKRLDDYCADREEPLANTGAPRWIATLPSEREFLEQSKLVSQISLSSTVKIARLDHNSHAFFVTSGLETSDPPPGTSIEECDAGILTAFLADLSPRPVALPSAIRNVVEFSDQTSTPQYAGHDPLLIGALFPPIQVFIASDLLEEETLKFFFRICLSDRRCIEQWIDQRLTIELARLTELRASSIPYVILCRAILDMDPSGLFLGLYRCLEALYSYERTREFMSKVGLEGDWVDIAQKAEETLGWYPREEPSLQTLLSKAPNEDLASIGVALKDPIPSNASPASFIAKRVYGLRNKLVHYRPLHRNSSVTDVDWNRLCEGMTNLVRHAYQEVYS